MSIVIPLPPTDADPGDTVADTKLEPLINGRFSEQCRMTRVMPDPSTLRPNATEQESATEMHRKAVGEENASKAEEQESGHNQADAEVERDIVAEETRACEIG